MYLYLILISAMLKVEVDRCAIRYLLCFYLRCSIALCWHVLFTIAEYWQQ